MDNMQLLTLVITILATFAGNLGFVLWFRKESREDWIRCQKTIDAIKDEMKDFHERLLDIEARRR